MVDTKTFTPGETYFASYDNDINSVMGSIDELVQKTNLRGNYYTLYSNLVACYWRNYAHYYKSLFSADSWQTALEFSGQNGEITKMTIPQARTLLRQFVNLITRQRLSWDVVTDVAGVNPLETARLGRYLCNYVSEKCKLDLLQEEMCELAALTGVGFYHTTWDTSKGYPHQVSQTEQGNELLEYSGDVSIKMVGLLDVFYNWSLDSWEDVNWAIVRTQKNRWDLIAQFPDMKDDIRAIPPARDAMKMQPNFNLLMKYQDDDTIYVYTFYHKKSPALPQGRMIVYLDQKTVLYDDVNPYEDIPIEPVGFEPIKNTLLYYPYFSSLLSQQEALDVCASAILSNIRAFGIHNVLNPRGNDISIEQVSDGLNFINYNPASAEGGGKPEILELLKIPPELFNTMHEMIQQMSDNAMISQAIKGNLPSNVSSGTAIATLSANAMEFLTSASKANSLALERVMNRVIRLYQKFATVPQITDICGVGNTGLIKEWKGTDLKGIKSVKIRTQNPLMSSSAGRIQVGDNLLQQGLISPKDYLGILAGNTPEEIFENEVSIDIQVKSELEFIFEGNDVIPMLTDNHPAYIKEYLKVLDSPYIRINSEPIMDKKTGQMTSIVAKMTELIKIRADLEVQLRMNNILYEMVRGQPSPMQQQMEQQLPPQQAGQEGQNSAQAAQPKKPKATV